MSPHAYQNKMVEAMRLQAEALARVEAKLDEQAEALALIIQQNEAAADRSTSKRSTTKP